MRKIPKYNDKNSRSSNHIWWMNDMSDLAPAYWPCSLVIVPTKQKINLNISFVMQISDSRSGMKGITIRQRMGKL